MTRVFRFSALIVSLILAQLGLTGSVTASGLSRPGKDVAFDACGADAAKEFCVEAMWFGATSEALAPIEVKTGAPSDTKWQSDVDSTYVYARFSDVYGGPTSNAGESGPYVHIDVKKHSGFEWGGGGPHYAGLTDGIYRITARLGDFDPTYAIIWADPLSYSVTKGDDGYFTIDMTFDPIAHLEVSNAASCIAAKWGSSCEAGFTFRNRMRATFATAKSAASRETARGWWLATNATRFFLGAPTVDPANKEVRQNFNVAAPHYVPAALEPYVDGAKEGSRELYPAMYKIFSPYTGIIDNLFRLKGQTVTVEQIKNYIGTGGDLRLYAGTVTNSAGVEVSQNITAVAGEKGVVIDFNIAHYSAPNPSLKTLDPDRRRSTLKNGALLNTLRSTSKGKTYTAASLFGPGSGAKVTKVTSKTKKNCSTKGTSVKMLKPGSCKVTIVVTKGTGKSAKTATANLTIPVS